MVVATEIHHGSYKRARYALQMPSRCSRCAHPALHMLSGRLNVKAHGVVRDHLYKRPRKPQQGTNGPNWALIVRQFGVTHESQRSPQQMAPMLEINRSYLCLLPWGYKNRTPLYRPNIPGPRTPSFQKQGAPMLRRS